MFLLTVAHDNHYSTKQDRVSCCRHKTGSVELLKHPLL